MKPFTFFILLNVALLPAISVAGAILVPVIETKSLPVVMGDETTIDKMSRTKNLEWLEIWGTFRKVRDCKWLRNEWYIGKRNGRAVGIKDRVEEKPKIRSDGIHSFGPWHVKIPVYVDLSEIYADSRHQCFIFDVPLPWITRSPFWN